MPSSNSHGKLPVKFFYYYYYWKIDLATSYGQVLYVASVLVV